MKNSNTVVNVRNKTFGAAEMMSAANNTGRLRTPHRLCW